MSVMVGGINDRRTGFLMSGSQGQNWGAVSSVPALLSVF